MNLTAKDIASFVGVAVSIIGLLITVVSGAMAYGTMKEKVERLELNQISGERIATLESEVKSLSRNSDELKLSVNNMLFYVRRRSDRERDTDRGDARREQP